jgi:ribose 5-phosphate isomerase B
MHTIEEAVSFVEVFVTTAFSRDPRHVRRIAMLADFEATGAIPEEPSGEAARSSVDPSAG